jgi:hypothetical protein
MHSAANPSPQIGEGLTSLSSPLATAILVCLSLSHANCGGPAVGRSPSLVKKIRHPKYRTQRTSNKQKLALEERQAQLAPSDGENLADASCMAG